jgi:hypothetical protein
MSTEQMTMRSSGTDPSKRTTANQETNAVRHVVLSDESREARVLQKNGAEHSQPV